MQIVVEFKQLENAEHGTWWTYYPILDALAAQQRVMLDLGCGWRNPSLLKPHEGRATCIGVDCDPSLPLQALQLKVAGDAYHLPFREGVFDLVSSSWVLEHIENPARYFREIARILGEGGHLLLMTNSLYNPATLAGKLLPQRWHRRILQGCLGERQRDYDNCPVFYRANTRRALTRYCRDAGFCSCRIVHFSGMHLHFGRVPWLRKAIFAIGNRLTDNHVLAFLKMNVILIAGKSRAQVHDQRERDDDK